MIGVGRGSVIRKRVSDGKGIAAGTYARVTGVTVEGMLWIETENGEVWITTAAGWERAPWRSGL